MLFKKDIGAFAGELKDKGYILLKDIVSDEFMSYLKSFHEKSVAGDIDENGAWRITGKKHQYVFSFPSDEAAEEFRDGMSRLTGLSKDSFTISERHLKQYELDAVAYPAPHKDRGASRFSIGIPIYLGPETSVCIFPDLDRDENTGDRAVFLKREQHADFDTIYKTKEALLLNEALGDIIVFHGSSMWHERVRPAGTAVLYMKVNETGHDPLGENVYGDQGAAKPAKVMEESY